MRLCLVVASNSIHFLAWLTLRLFLPPTTTYPSLTLRLDIYKKIFVMGQALYTPSLNKSQGNSLFDNYGQDRKPRALVPHISNADYK